MEMMKLHGHVKSTCVARVLLCLHEKGLQFKFVPIDFASASHKQQPHLSLNPFGQIPALEDGDLSLFESRAITRYLARKHKDSGTDLLRLDNLKESAIIDTWMEVEAHQFNGPMSSIIRQVIINPMFGRDPDKEVIEFEMEKLGKVLDVYEERLSKFKYLAGDEYYTMADLHHIPYLVYFMRTPHATAITSRPRVNAWWNDISSRPATINVSKDLKI